MHISAKAAFLVPAWVSLLHVRSQGSLALGRLQPNQTTCNLLDVGASSLRRGHANLVSIVPSLRGDLRRESAEGLRLLRGLASGAPAAGLAHLSSLAMRLPLRHRRSNSFCADLRLRPKGSSLFPSMGRRHTSGKPTKVCGSATRWERCLNQS